MGPGEGSRGWCGLGWLVTWLVGQVGGWLTGWSAGIALVKTTDKGKGWQVLVFGWEHDANSSRVEEGCL